MSVVMMQRCDWCEKFATNLDPVREVPWSWDGKDLLIGLHDPCREQITMDSLWRKVWTASYPAEDQIKGQHLCSVCGRKFATGRGLSKHTTEMHAFKPDDTKSDTKPDDTKSGTTKSGTTKPGTTKPTKKRTN